MSEPEQGRGAGQGSREDPGPYSRPRAQVYMADPGPQYLYESQPFASGSRVDPLQLQQSSSFCPPTMNGIHNSCMNGRTNDLWLDQRGEYADHRRVVPQGNWTHPTSPADNAQGHVGSALSFVEPRREPRQGADPSFREEWPSQGLRAATQYGVHPPHFAECPPHFDQLGEANYNPGGGLLKPLPTQQSIPCPTLVGGRPRTWLTCAMSTPLLQWEWPPWGYSWGLQVRPSPKTW